MKKLILILLLTNSNHYYSQQNFGVKASGGLSQITTNVEDKKTSFLPSYNVGFFYSFQIKKHSLIGFELLYLQINGKEHTETKFTDPNGNHTGDVLTEDVTRKISYFSIPVYYSIIIKRFILNVGFQTSFQLNNNFNQKGQYTYNGETINYQSSGKLKLSTFDVGPRAGLNFKLTKRFSIDANYYYGLYNIDSHNFIGYGIILRNQQASLGLRYTFCSIAPKDKKQ